MIFKIVNVDSLIIYFGDKIDEDIALKIKKVYQGLRKLNLDGLIEIIPSYTSIFITFDIFKYDFETLKNIIEQNINLDLEENFDEKIITVDVYYGTEVGLYHKNNNATIFPFNSTAKGFNRKIFEYRNK